MCLKGFKVKRKKPKIKNKKNCSEAKVCGTFSQVQQVNLKNKICAPPRGIYMLTHKKKIRKFHKQIKKKESLLEGREKNSF